MTTNTKVNIVVDVENEEEIQKLVSDMKELARTLPKAQKAQSGLVKQTKQTQIEMRKFGRGMQNASYQIQDFIVQVTGGVDPLKSFAQQAPQLLINMGALGAVVGVVAASLPILIQYFNEGEEETADFAKAIDGLNSALDASNKVASSIDFTKWNQEWNGATESVREMSLALLKYNLAVAEDSFRKAQESVLQSVEIPSETMKQLDFLRELLTATREEAEAAGGVWNAAMKRYEEGGYTIEKVAAQFNMGEKEAKEFLAILNSGLNGNDLLTRLAEFGASGAGAGSSEYQQLVRDLEEYVNQWERLQQLQNQVAAAEGSSETGALLPDGKKTKEASNGLREYEAALREIYNAYKVLNPEAVTFFEQVQTYNTALEANLITMEQYSLITEQLGNNFAKAGEQASFMASVMETNKMFADSENNTVVESFDLMTESLDIFESSFERAFNGVAMGTQTVSDAFKNMARVIIAEMGKMLAYQGIASLFGGQSTIGAAASRLLTGSAQGNAFSGGNVVPFAKGGVVNQPTVFPMAKGAGLMGEAGPEAVMPLRRMGNGNLGVESSGMNVTVNNMAQGVSVNPRQGSDGLTIDVVLAQAARAVQSGGNVFADSIEKTYSVNRGRGVY